MSDPQDEFESFLENIVDELFELGFSEEFSNMVSDSLNGESHDEDNLMVAGYNFTFMGIQRLRILILRKLEEESHVRNPDITYSFDEVDERILVDSVSSPLGVINITDLTVPYFVLCNEMNHRLIRVLFASEIIDEDYLDKEGTLSLINGLSNQQMEQTLYKNDVIGKDLHKDVVRVNTLRNDAAHNPFISLGSGSIENIRNDVECGINSINGMAEALYGYPIYHSDLEE